MMVASMGLKHFLVLCGLVVSIGESAAFVNVGNVRSSTFLLSSSVETADANSTGEFEAEVKPVEEASTDTSILRYELKNKLLKSVASSDRGQLASSSEKETISSLISELEALNPIEDTTTSTFSKGTWELIYSDTQLFRSSPFFMAGRAVCKDGDEAEQYDWFCDMHRAALAISTIGKVRQIISSTTLTSEFEVKVGAVPFLNDFTPFAYSGGWPATIEGAIVSSASIEPSPVTTAYSLFMDTVEIKGSNIPLLRSILDNPSVNLQSRQLGGFLEQTFPDQYTNPKPLFETVYLDEDGLRISKDQDGKLFVYNRVSESEEVTEYHSVMADLGVGKLLENFNDKILKFYI